MSAVCGELFAASLHSNDDLLRNRYLHELWRLRARARGAATVNAVLTLLCLVTSMIGTDGRQQVSALALSVLFGCWAGRDLFIELPRLRRALFDHRALSHA